MGTLFWLRKPKSLPSTSLSLKGKRCSTNSANQEKEKCFPDLGTLQLPTKNKVHMPLKGLAQPKKPNAVVEQKIRVGGLPFDEDLKHRTNALNIQMLSGPLYQQVFQGANQNQPDPQLIEKAKEELQQHGLCKDEINYLKDVSLNIPPLQGGNIEEHFWAIGEEQCKPYRELVDAFIKNGLPKTPSEWLCQKGWTKYVDGEQPVSVPFPDDDAFVFDVEVNVKLGELPTLATAVSSHAWYGWVCSDLAEGVDSIPTSLYKTNMLIPFEGKAATKDKPRVIVGHNVSYDRARIKEQYFLKNSALRFLDTMSLHICIGGLTKSQKSTIKRKTADFEVDIGKETCLCSLKDLYSLYCNKELEKEPRNVFTEGLLPDVRKDFQVLMNYCANDVKATYEVLQAIFPVFLQRFSHPVTLAGMLEMGSAFLPVNNNWCKFLTEADQTYEDLKNELSSILSKKCDAACRLLNNEDYKKDMWMWSEDWTTQQLKLTKRKIKPKEDENQEEKAKKCDEKLEEEEDEEETRLMSKYQHLFNLGELLPKKLPFLPGYPLWYRKLCKRPGSQDWSTNPQLSTSMLVTPKLLKLSWENFPLHHTQEYGWGILIPDLFAEDVETAIPFEQLKELTIKNCNVQLDKLKKSMKSTVKGNEKNASAVVPFYQGSGVWCNHVIDNCCFFFKIPHRDGTSKNVGTPLSRDISHVFSSGVLSSSDSAAELVLDLGKKITYWRNNRQRITSQMVVWLSKKEACVTNACDEDSITGVIIPKVVVCGTLTRRAMESTWLTASKVTLNRIGSELRSMIQAPPGYHFVGADVDSQELWIASLIGDSHYAKVHGATPLGWMTLSGTKSSGTDMHSVTAKAVGISRDHAKIINYARIYGAGVKFAEKLIKQFNPSMSSNEAKTKAFKMYSITKGKKEFQIKKSVADSFSNASLSHVKIHNLSSAVSFAKRWGKKVEEMFERPQWVNGTESAMFNQLEKIASSSKPVTPFLQCRLSRALEPRFEGDDLFLNTRVNWVVQSGAVDFLHLMLVCMKWLTNGKARYSFSFHDEVRYLVPSEERYGCALAMHITNLLVRSFCAYRLGMYDLPQSVAFFSSVEVDKTLRKEANDDCVTPSNPHGMEKGYGIPPGESLNIYEAIEKSGGNLPFGTGKKRASSTSRNRSSKKTEALGTEMSEATKRKHVHREVLQGELVPPKENQQIVRVLGSRGSNLHEVQTADSSTFLTSMPSKFRKNVWIKRGDYILVEPIEEGGKVKAEIVNILTPDYIKFLKKENLWPSGFTEETEQEEADEDNLFVNNNRKTFTSENESTEDEEDK